ncbi:MAG TPA: ankyrin repeat domain-containing protein [Tepidisphaeraceae bacterium]|jgi:hypothetical protein|nr:ankyrin repeat domain-containing protein [Tepidisphaeraceae bacterium]
METLLNATYLDDPAAVKNLLAADPGLAKRTIQTPKLYTGNIDHWLYAGDTALHLAAAGYRVEIVPLLLAGGADANAAQNHRRSTPLHYAADGYLAGSAWNAANQLKTLALLLHAGADIHTADKNGATALHRAVRTRCSDAVTYLLKSGANPKAKNKPGSTPFHLAVQNTGRGGSGAQAAIAAQRQIIAAFLAQHVSTTLTDGKGKTVIDCAKSQWIKDALAAGG